MKPAIRLQQPIRTPNGMRITGFVREPDPRSLQLLVQIAAAVAVAQQPREGRRP